MVHLGNLRFLLWVVVLGSGLVGDLISKGLVWELVFLPCLIRLEISGALLSPSVRVRSG